MEQNKAKLVMDVNFETEEITMVLMGQLTLKQMLYFYAATKSIKKQLVESIKNIIDKENISDNEKTKKYLKIKTLIDDIDAN